MADLSFTSKDLSSLTTDALVIGVAATTVLFARFAELRHHIYEQIQLAKAGVVPAQIAAGVSPDHKA